MNENEYEALVEWSRQ